MILVGNQRGGARNLALHLMKQENERVEIYDLRGFVAQDLQGAFRESEAISRATKCRQHLYSLSLNPPADADVSKENFEDAIKRAETRLGLTGQPRAIVFHEKYGEDGQLRRHAHAVWCRIDTEHMRAVHLSHDRQKLQDVSRTLYLEHGWKMPRGFVRHQDSDPRNYSLAEWQQAKRAKHSPEDLKAMFQDAWAMTDSKAAFGHALQEHGFILARGDRRGYVAVDHRGEVYAIAKWVGIKTKQVRDRLGDHSELPNVQDAHTQAARRVTDRLQELRSEEKERSDQILQDLEDRRARQAKEHAVQQKRLREAQTEKRQANERMRKARLRKGWRGLIDYITGKRKQIEAENQEAALLARERDQASQNAQTREQRKAAFDLERRKARVEFNKKAIEQELENDIQDLKKSSSNREDRQQDFHRRRRNTSQRPKRGRSRDGPEP